jgi:hypothetical protein
VRAAGEIDVVAHLAEMGLSQRRIASVTGIPRGTVKMWLAGQVPRHRAACCGLGTRSPGAAYSHLLGLYLGDGHVSTYGRVARLRIFFDSRYPRLIGEGVRTVRLVVPASRVHAARRAPDNCVVVSSYSRCWPCLLPQHGPGRKHERAIELEPWQRAITHAHPESFIRGLLHSDGCRFVNPVTVGGRRYEYPRYLFTNRSADIKRLFCEHLDLLAIEWRTAGARNISIAKRASVARLDEFVGPKR